MFDIDRYLNPYIPASRLDRLPAYVSRWFGYRDPDDESLTDTLTPIIKGKHGYLKTNLWIFFSTFAGIILTMCACRYSQVLVHHGVPVFVPSWAAGSILMFNALRAPLAQPRNAVIGTFLSSIIGVGLSKLFMLSRGAEEYLWIAGALATSLASIVMLLTKTVHPPGGAAAMLPCVDIVIRRLGWYYLPLQLLISAIFLGTACIFNNMSLVYPMYWWTPLKLDKDEEDTSRLYDPTSTGTAKYAADVDSNQNINEEKYTVDEDGARTTEAPVDGTYYGGFRDQITEPTSAARRDSLHSQGSQDFTRTSTNRSDGLSRTFTGASLRLARTGDSRHIGSQPLQITIKPDLVELPPLLRLTPEQKILLEQLQNSLNTVNVISPEEL